MSQTEKYGLYITEDADDPRFLEFRKQLCGSENSNMTKIDKALSEKADSSVSVEVTLYADKWVDGKQTVIVDGLSEDQNGVVSLPHNISSAEYESISDASLAIENQAKDSLTFVSNGTLPVIDITIIIIIIH